MPCMRQYVEQPSDTTDLGLGEGLLVGSSAGLVLGLETVRGLCNSLRPRLVFPASSQWHVKLAS